MRRASLLETQVRRETENERAGVSDGISSEDFLQYFTDGQLFIQRAVLTKHAKAFKGEYIFSAPGTERIALPADALGHNVISLEYSQTGNAKDYFPINKRTMKERISVVGDPEFYIPDGSSLIVNPYPSRGTFRLNYNQMVPRVDKRRGVVISHTKSTTALTALTVSTLSGYEAVDYGLSDHISIVDFNGVTKMRGIPYSAIDENTGVVSIEGTSYTFPEGSTLSNGDYYCLGQNASSHLQLPDWCEDFVLRYCAKRVFNRDSSADAVEATQDMRDMALQIIECYSDGTDDVDEIPILNYDYALDI